MKIVTEKKKRKLIDLSPEVERMLSILAASQGKNLKAYIESVLEYQAQKVNEDILLAELAKEPEANIPATPEEEKEIRNLLGL